MEEVKANELFMKYKDLVPNDKALILKQALLSAPDTAYAAASGAKVKKPGLALLFTFIPIGGWDRLYLGSFGGFVIKNLLNLVTGYIYWLIDLFSIKKRAKEKNFDIIMKCLV